MMPLVATISAKYPMKMKEEYYLMKVHTYYALALMAMPRTMTPKGIPGHILVFILLMICVVDL